MQVREVLLGLSTSLIATLFCQSSSAFTLHQSAATAGHISRSQFDDGEGITTLISVDPDEPFNLFKARPLVSKIKLGGSKGFLEDLQVYRNENWTFKKGRELKGSFNVKVQYACGIKTSCGKYTGLETATNGIGSALSLTYRPGTSTRQPNPDPKKTNYLHWIQRVTTNYPGTDKIGPVGTTASYIDNIPTRGPTEGQRALYPYYGSGQPLNSNGVFEDRPYRPQEGNNLKRNYFWTAELYLAEANPLSPREITIYDGVRWGWTYNYFRKPDLDFVPVPVPLRNPIRLPPLPPLPFFSEPKLVRSDASGGGGIGYVAASPSPTPRPTPSPLPTPSPWTPSPLPTPTPWTPSPLPTPTPWVTSTLGSTSSTVVVSTSTTIASPSPFQGPSSPAPSPRPARAARPGGRPIRAVPLSASSNANAANLPKSSLFESSSKANTDYFTTISSGLLEDPELSSTDNSLNNANIASLSRDLLENPELSSTDSNENQVNLAGISSDLLEDPELSSTDSNEDQVNLAGISSDLLEDPELSSTDSDENNADLADISADLLEDPELSSEDHNSDRVDLAGISSDLLEDPELSYLDDTLTATTPKVSAKNTDDDALAAEAVPEPTTGLGTLFALAILPVIKRLKNRKNQE